jgi:hypothetical protein
MPDIHKLLSVLSQCDCTILFYVIKLKIIDGDGIAVLASALLKHFKYTALLQYALEEVE